MADKPELESLYREAQSALRAKEYDQKKMLPRERCLDKFYNRGRNRTNERSRTTEIPAQDENPLLAIQAEKRT
jgi:hypothetical protein